MREPVKPYKTGQDALTRDEAALLIQKAPTYGDRALLRFAIATGMRREDVVNVALKDLDLEACVVRFYDHKKDKPWEASFDRDTADELRRYLETLPKGTPWLFPSPRDGKQHMNDKTAYNRLQACLDHAGLRRRPFHALRATFIKLAQKRGWTIDQVMDQTGDTFRVIKEHYDTPSRDEMRQVAKEKPLL